MCLAFAAVQIDRPLVRRLETSAATTTVELAGAMRSIDAGSPAATLPMGDGALIALGPGRYVNRGVGVTLGELSAGDLDSIEHFFGDRQLPPAVELTSWAPAPTIAELTRRDYRPNWFRAMFAIEPGRSSAASAHDVHVEAVDDTNLATWLDVYGAAFDVVDAGRLISDEMALASHAAAGVHVVMATIDGQPAGCGLVHVADGVGWIGGAATMPQFRRRGVQATLIAHRLRLATDLGCDVAAATAVPSGESARNLVRHGFQLVQTQVVVEQASPC